MLCAWAFMTSGGYQANEALRRWTTSTLSTQKGATGKNGPRSVGVAALTESKDQRLRILSETPIVLETPHSLLAGHTVTPKPILFVRNVQKLLEGRTPEPFQLADWDIVVAGLIGEPVTIRGEELLEMG